MLLTSQDRKKIRIFFLFPFFCVLFFSSLLMLFFFLFGFSGFSIPFEGRYDLVNPGS